MSLTKTKTRNQLSPDTLSKLRQIKNELQKLVHKKKKKDKQKTISIPESSEENVDIFFEDIANTEELEQDEELAEVNEQIELINIDNDDIFIIEDFFDFEIFQKNQENFSLIEVQDSSTAIKNKKWSIEDILNQ